jgi:C-terminal processing protease CtpA/Prc
VVLPYPEPERKAVVRASPVAIPAPKAKKPAPQKAAPAKGRNVDQYWIQQAQRFNKLLERLNHEQDPARRQKLLQAIAQYVRVDTLAALDWAMSLENPKERRAALDAINKNALSGIGARIEMDETGFPKIKETTVLSAIGSTGLVEPGDYIVGMMDGNGQPVYFEGRPTKQVVQFLRGQPGSEIRLMMERVPTEGTVPYAFDVTVQRSLIVIHPPF